MDLFDDLPPPSEAEHAQIAPGAVLLRGFARAGDADWLETVRTRRRFYCMISPGPLIASLKRPSSRGLVPPLRRDGAGLA